MTAITGLLIALIVAAACIGFAAGYAAGGRDCMRICDLARKYQEENR